MSQSPHFLEPLLTKAAPVLALYVSGRNTPVATTVEVAFSSDDRLRGLLGRSSLPSDSALIIAPCNAVHTFRMQFAIDVVYAARDGQILKVVRAMRANRISGAIGAFATIEFAAGSASRAELKRGQVLRVAPVANLP
ncbi:MAG: DUF192 domain-containing protein [Vicinamibacterales bacterium]